MKEINNMIGPRDKLLCFFNNGTIPASFSFIFVLLSFLLQLQNQYYKLKKAYIVCFAFEPGTTRR